MNNEYLEYPPFVVDDLEIVEQRGNSRRQFIVGSRSSDRLILLGETECHVLELLSGNLTPPQVCEEFQRRYQAKLSLPTLSKFLRRLDETGLLAGVRSAEAPGKKNDNPQFYARWKLFNPDRLFGILVSRVRWIWSTSFVIATTLLMAIALALILINVSDVSTNVLQTMREHYLAVFIAATFITISHEFAHGLTCKAFGGRVSEVGVLMVYYVLPGLYCNVSGAYLIPERKHRLWVILAGIYWQVLVGTSALIIWFLVQPHTLISTIAFIVFLGGVADVFFNANPLIKLDGYYFLSQWLHLPNLMDRSREFWREKLRRVLFGEKNQAAVARTRREASIYCAFGFLSFLYTVGLRIAIVIWVGRFLTDKLNLLGLILTAALAAFYTRRTFTQIVVAICKVARELYASLFRTSTEDVMSTNEAVGINRRRRWIVSDALVAVAVGILCLPWTASVGNYGTLVALPDREVIIRAPEDSTLIELVVQPGSRVTEGARIGRMGDLELEEQLVEAHSELTRAKGDYEKVLGEIRTREELVARANLELGLRRHEFNDIRSEDEQINQRESDRALSNRGPVTSYPPSIAVLESDIEMLKVRLQEANAQVERSQQLFSHGVASRSELDSLQTAAASLSLELGRARERLEGAIVEHRRKYTTTAYGLDQAGTDLRGEQLQIELLKNQLRSEREFIGLLESRAEVLRRKQAQFELVSTHAGTVFGEELPRMVRQHFKKGEEICRVADTRQLLVRLQIPERELNDVRVDNHVRLKVSAYPDRTFQGIVSKIGSESERDEQNGTTYRVELSIDNSDEVLRPGMTAFARIDFGRRSIGGIVIHKVKQLLRTEVWML
jgi:multidrug efflux pump subunit AcrA (membrane-fusion protein)